MGSVPAVPSSVQLSPKGPPKGRVAQESPPWFLNDENYRANELSNCPLSAGGVLLAVRHRDFQYATAAFRNEPS